MEPFEPRGEQRPGADLAGPRDRASIYGSDRASGLGVDRASAARLDQMRARGVSATPAAPRAVFAWVLVAALLAFALGLIANPWFERSVRSHLPGFAPTLTPTVADLGAIEARVAALEARPARTVTTAAGPNSGSDTGDGLTGERLARVEATVATLGATVPAAGARADKIAVDLATLTGRIDAGAAATAATLATATATAERAQAMLVVADVRRQLTAGARLGALEPALRRSFAGRAEPAVEAVAALGAAPVTLAALRAGLEQLRPALTGEAVASATTGHDWWQGLRETLAGVITRPAPGSGSDATSRVDRAARALASGNPAAAIAEINTLPPAARTRAQAWLAAAGRYDAAWRALGQLEGSLLDPAIPSPLASALPRQP